MIGNGSEVGDVIGNVPVWKKQVVKQLLMTRKTPLITSAGQSDGASRLHHWEKVSTINKSNNAT